MARSGRVEDPNASSSPDIRARNDAAATLPTISLRLRGLSEAMVIYCSILDWDASQAISGFEVGAVMAAASSHRPAAAARGRLGSGLRS
jgi:shikimate kinase